MGLSFLEGLAKSTSMILVSEIGDKTFFVAALMAMRHPRRFVLAGALGALWVMTLLSAAFGWAAPSLIPAEWTHHAATLLFLVFGLRSLWEGFSHEGGESKELKEVEAELGDAIRTPRPQQQNGAAGNSNGNGGGPEESKEEKARKRLLSRWLSPILLKTFSLTFLGEWGDRSQVATIGLAAQENVWGVALGGMIGHLVCTTAAVLGGRHVASRISEQMVAISGGLLFVAFGIHSFFSGVGA